jgi:hypothetical protein
MAKIPEPESDTESSSEEDYDSDDSEEEDDYDDADWKPSGLHGPANTEATDRSSGPEGEEEIQEELQPMDCVSCMV